MLHPENSAAVKAAFKKDLEDLHLVYDYDAQNVTTGEPEKWRYEIWLRSSDRVVYAIHGGPMAGRLNFQKADYQCIREGELWQINWLEETGSLVSLCLDLPQQRITAMIGFSIGHWTQAEQAHGDKRDPEDFARWRKLAEIGKQTDRHILYDQAVILESFRGSGDLQDIDLNAPTL
ncbi:hypothetical protein BGZ70_009941 [Mortierella alpina]|uniref:Phenol acid carboxylase n=1 Tax=Mortierella alpina TaxID=64518 RepID=A0A9P6J083_MORAP|nr:hypothetical protein BGZ70_009941 [Mortierella alpina]